MGLFDFLKPAWKHPDSNRRKISVQNLKNEKILQQLSSSDPDEGVRRLAFDRIADMKVLAEIARSASHPFSEFALERISGNNPALLLVAVCGDYPQQLEAIKKIHDPGTLNRVISDVFGPNRRDLQSAAQERLKEISG